VGAQMTEGHGNRPAGKNVCGEGEFTLEKRREPIWCYTFWEKETGVYRLLGGGRIGRWEKDGMIRSELKDLALRRHFMPERRQTRLTTKHGKRKIYLFLAMTTSALQGKKAEDLLGGSRTKIQTISKKKPCLGHRKTGIH